MKALIDIALIALRGIINHQTFGRAFTAHERAAMQTTFMALESARHYPGIPE